MARNPVTNRHGVDLRPSGAKVKFSRGTITALLAFVAAVFIGAMCLEQLALGHEEPEHCQRQAESFEVDPRFCAGCTPDQFVQDG